MSNPVRPDIQLAREHIRGLLPNPHLDLPDLIATSRYALDHYGDAAPRKAHDCAVVRAEMANINAHWIVPPQVSGPERIVWFHGGGLIGGSIVSHEPMAAELARATARPVLVVGYRLAPEHQMPAAHDDCYAALAFAQGNGPNGPGRAAVWLVGDSIGAGLAMWTCNHALKQHDTPPERIVLLSATLNLIPDGRPATESDPLISGPTLGGIALYAGDVPLSDARLSTLNIPDSELAKFPPVMLQVSGGEYLLPDSIALADRLARLGRSVRLSVWPDMPHVWHSFLTLLPESGAALREVARFLIEPN